MRACLVSDFECYISYLLALCYLITCLGRHRKALGVLTTQPPVIPETPQMMEKNSVSYDVALSSPMV